MTFQRNKPRLTTKQRLARKARWRQQLPRFALIGLLNASIDLGIFNLLLLMNPTRDAGQLVAYNTIGVAAAIINSYFWNSRWTFAYRPSQEPKHKRRQRRVFFVLQAIVNIVINNAVLSGLVVAFTAWDLHLTTVFTAADATKVIATIVASAVSFMLMKFVVFRRVWNPELSVSQQ